MTPKPTFSAACEAVPYKDSEVISRSVKRPLLFLVFERSEMFAQSAEARQDEEATGSAAHFFVFELPGGMVRNEHGVQPRLQGGIDIAPRAVPDHPSV